MSRWCDVRDRFGSAAVGYFDTPSMGAPTRATIEALRGALDDWLSGAARFERWEESVRRCRQSWADLAGADEAAVGTGASIVPAVAATAQALARRPGRVLLHADEFRSLALPVFAAFGEPRVTTVSGPYASSTFIDGLGGDVSVVAISSVSSATGERPDLARLVEAADAAGAVVIVDSTQSEGIVQLGPPAERFQAVFAAGYKGLLGPRGTSYSYIREDLDLRPLVEASPYGMADNDLRGSYGAPGVPFPGGRGVTQSPAWLAWVGAEAGLDLLRTVSASDRESHAVGRAEQLRAGLVEAGFAVEPSELPSHITTVPHPDSASICEVLEQAGIRAAARLGRLRFGTHLYTDGADVDRAVDALRGARSSR